MTDNQQIAHAAAELINEMVLGISTDKGMEHADAAIIAAIEPIILAAIAEAQAWRTIDSALKDEPLLLYFPETTGRQQHSSMMRVDSVPVTYPRQPSHWQHLPPDPGATT